MVIELQRSVRAMARFTVKLSHNDHTVTVVDEGCGTLSSGATVRLLHSCRSLHELWHHFQWSYGKMIINFQSLEGSYCKILFILKYKFSLTYTILLAGHLVQLISPNHNSTLQNRIHLLRKTITPHYKVKITSVAKHMEMVLSNRNGKSTLGAVHFTVY